MLSYLFPYDTKLWHDRAAEAAKSREYGGIHFPMDDETGLKMGREIGRHVVARARSEGA